MADQSLRVVRTELGKPVVISAEARALQAGVVEAEKPHPKRRVQDFRLDAVNILVLDPLGGVPSARPRRFVALAQMLLQFRSASAGAETAGHRERTDTRRYENITGAFVILNHA